MSHRSSLRQRLARVLLAAGLLTSGTVLATAGAAHAGGCAGGGIVCGKVENSTSVGMLSTVALNASNAPDRCAVWNPNGGTSRNQVVWKCWQRYLAPHSHRGGNFTGVDVDAFTFADRPYYLVIDGQNFLIQQGVWTKFADYETATCEDYLPSAPRCIVWTTG